MGIIAFSLRAIGCRVPSFKPVLRGGFALGLALAFALFLPAFPVVGYPPAPSHLIYGLVRDEYGVPLSLVNAQVLFEPTNGVQIAGTVVPNLAPGMNYRLSISMDSGIAPDLYKVTALRPFVPFRIRVKIGAVTYLPMQMTGSFAQLGQPAQATRIDLTLGVDANGDGLPDALQQLLIARLGAGARIGPDEDADGDGISNLNEYLAGTYAFAPESGFRLELIPNLVGPPLLEFMVVSSHSYTVYSSTDLQTWLPIEFDIPSDGLPAKDLSGYHASDTRILQVAPVIPAGSPVTGQYFKVMVQ